MPVSHSVTVDRSGRLVVPKALRDELGIQPGQPLRASAHDGRLEIEPVPLEADLVDVDGVLVITPRAPVAPMSREDVRALIESVRT